MINRQWKVSLILMALLQFYIVWAHPGIHQELSDAFRGIDYSGNAIFYTEALFMFCLIMFSGFNETNKYMSGYGVNIFTRTKRRGTITITILEKLLIRAVIWSAWILMTHAAASLLLQEIKVSFMDLKYVGLFMLVIYSMFVWQAIIEIWFDARISFLVSVVSFLIVIYFDNLRQYYNMSEKWMMLLYVNMGFKGRMEYPGLSIVQSIFALVLIISVQILILLKGIKRKDIV